LAAKGNRFPVEVAPSRLIVVGARVPLQRSHEIARLISQEKERECMRFGVLARTVPREKAVAKRGFTIQNTLTDRVRIPEGSSGMGRCSLMENAGLECLRRFAGTIFYAVWNGKFIMSARRWFPKQGPSF